jgi:hypothetical protein
MGSHEMGWDKMHGTMGRNFCPIQSHPIRSPAIDLRFSALNRGQFADSKALIKSKNLFGLD